MSREYLTSEEHLPDEPGTAATLQVTDRETKEIFTTRARVSPHAGDLTDPDRLTVVRGPHEHVEEQWFIEILEAGVEADYLDPAVLRDCIRQTRDGTNVVNTRADDVLAILTYLVERGEYESVSDAARLMLRDFLGSARPDLVDAYIEERARVERDDLAAELRGADG